MMTVSPLNLQSITPTITNDLVLNDEHVDIIPVGVTVNEPATITSEYQCR